MPRAAKQHRPTSEPLKSSRREPNSTKRGYGYRWQQARAVWLRDHPLCEHCETITIATIVDHVKPHKGDMAIFWDRANWQSLCKACHDKKTATEDGGFGNQRKGKRA